jgi:hypothetical protein
MLRLSGPFGPSLISRMRPDLINKFDSLFPEDLTEEERFAKLTEIIPSYLFHCNAHSPRLENFEKAKKNFALSQLSFLT